MRCNVCEARGRKSGSSIICRWGCAPKAVRCAFEALLLIVHVSSYLTAPGRFSAHRKSSLGRLLRLPWLPRLPRAPPLPPAGVTGVAGEGADTFPGVPADEDGDAAMGARATSVGWNVPVEMTCQIRIAFLNDC